MTSPFNTTARNTSSNGYYAANTRQVPIRRIITPVRFSRMVVGTAARRPPPFLPSVERQRNSSSDSNTNAPIPLRTGRHITNASKTPQRATASVTRQSRGAYENVKFEPQRGDFYFSDASQRDDDSSSHSVTSSVTSDDDGYSSDESSDNLTTSTPTSTQIKSDDDDLGSPLLSLDFAAELPPRGKNHTRAVKESVPQVEPVNRNDEHELLVYLNNTASTSTPPPKLDLASFAELEQDLISPGNDHAGSDDVTLSLSSVGISIVHDAVVPVSRPSSLQLVRKKSQRRRPVTEAAKVSYDSENDSDESDYELDPDSFSVRSLENFSFDSEIIAEHLMTLSDDSFHSMLRKCPNPQWAKVLTLLKARKALGSTVSFAKPP